MVVRGKMRKSQKWQMIGAQTITNGWKVLSWNSNM
jgi:hypothetical protein